MDVEYGDFGGEFEWICVGDRIIFDKNFYGLAELIQYSQQEVERLAAEFNNKPLDKNLNTPKLQSLLCKLEYKYEQLYISDLSGLYYNADGNTNYIMDRRYFSQVISGNTVISEPIINRSTGRPIIAVATPIFNNKKVVGLFGLTILIKSYYRGVHFLPTNGRRKKNNAPLNKGRRNQQDSVMSA